MKSCHVCHMPITGVVKFCGYCGAKLIAPAQICPDCRTENDLDAKSCGHCGFHLLGNQDWQTTIFETIKVGKETEIAFSKIAIFL